MRKVLGETGAFWVDCALLACSAPALYFPAAFPAWARPAALLLLAGGWLWRRRQLGVWRARTPADPALIGLLLLLPVALWAAPEPLRQRYSWPRAGILLWNTCLFWLVVTYGSRSWRCLRLSAAGFFAAATGIALLAPLGMAWLYKFRPLQPLLDNIPSPLVGIFQGAESGFHPNQVAGTLLYALPLMLALSAAGLWARPVPRRLRLLLPATFLVAAILVLTQSRAALLGLAASLLLMALIPWRWGRYALLVMGAGVIVLLPFIPAGWLDLLGDPSTAAAMGGTGSLGFRQRVWTMALWGLADFPFTGMGLGTFRAIAPLLYNLDIPAGYDIVHAHNLFLQTGLDFGLLGMVCLMALYLAAAVQLGGVAQSHASSMPDSRAWAVGLGGSLAGSLVFSLLDAVTMGAKTNFMLWFLFGLVFALGNLTARRRSNLRPARPD